MRFVARLASSPRVTTLELPRPSTRDDPPPSVDPPPTAAALDLSDALDDDDDTDRDGLGFFARAPASSRRRRAGSSDKAPPQKSASPSRASSRAPMRVRADARAPTPPKSKSSLDDDDDDDAIARRRLASPRATRVVIKAHGDRATSRRSSESSARAPRAASQDSRRARVSGRSPPIRLPAANRREGRAARPLTTREDEPSSARPNFPYVRTDTLPPYESVRIPRSRGGRDESDSSRASREPIETLDPSARALEREAIRARARRPAHDDAPHERCLDEVKENPARRPRADPPRRACNSRSAGSRAT